MLSCLLCVSHLLEYLAQASLGTDSIGKNMSLSNDSIGKNIAAPASGGYDTLLAPAYK